MNIDAADKMPNLAVKPDGVHPKLEKYILRKVRTRGGGGRAGRLALFAALDGSGQMPET